MSELNNVLDQAQRFVERRYAGVRGLSLGAAVGSFFALGYSSAPWWTFAVVSFVIILPGWAVNYRHAREDRKGEVKP